jgi:hypothetical protein
MERNILVIFMKIKGREKEYLNGKMGKNTEVIGKMGSNTDKEFIKIQREKKGKVSG